MTTQAAKAAVRSRVRKESRAGTQKAARCQTGGKAPALNVRLALAGHPLAIVGFPILRMIVVVVLVAALFIAWRWPLAAE